jgi:integrase/recombinase XerD
LFDDVERDIGSIRLPRWGRVVSAEGVVPWLVVDDGGVPVEPIRRYLSDFVARDTSTGSVRSYAYALMRWWRWLRAVDVAWDKATPAEVRDLVLWLKQARKHNQRRPRSTSVTTAGTVNPVTRKRYLGDQYEPRTIRHSNAVIRAFYEYWIEDVGAGPLINPVQLARRGRRPNAHHNPLEPLRPEGKIRYNPKVPKRQVREIPDNRWTELFAGLRSNRDRAILALTVSKVSAPLRSSVFGVWTWTGVTSSCESSARAAAPSSGCRPARRPSSGFVSTWLSWPPRSTRTNRCGGRCAAAIGVGARGGSR